MSCAEDSFSVGNGWCIEERSLELRPAPRRQRAKEKKGGTSFGMTT
jgi:hypothetical protein